MMKSHSIREKFLNSNETALSLFSGILGLFIPIGGIIFSIAGIIYGVQAYRAKSQKNFKGKGWSITGIIIGYIGVVTRLIGLLRIAINLIK